MIKYSMGKGPLERRERLHRVCKSIIDNPRSVDAGTVAAFKSAALRFVHTQYDDETEGLEALYRDDGELGSSLRKAVEIIDEAGRADDIAKAGRDHRVGATGLAAATSELALDLIHHHRRRLGLVAKGVGQLEESNMRHTETLESILKDSGPVSVCKAIVDRGRSPCGEHELVTALTKAASEQHPELSPAQAFAELYKTESVWRACAIADLTPVQVGGEDTRDLSDTSKAIEQLKALGARRWPTASAADQFERALTAPENHVLARRAVPIPRATTSFPFPR